MLFLQGVCFVIAFLILITSNLCTKRKIENVASRMEITGEPMQIHVSENTWLKTKNAVQYRSPVMVEEKGKGKMNCYFVNEDWCE